MDPIEGKLVEVSRTFEAPLELLWKSWTDPAHFMNWYGPKGFTVPMCMIDLQVGGRHLWNMRSPDGRDMYFTGVFKEVVSMERLVFTDTMSDADGNIMEVKEGMGDPRNQTMEVTVTFMHADGKTTVTVSHMAYGPGAEHAGMGWEQALEKLAGVLATD